MRAYRYLAALFVLLLAACSATLVGQRLDVLATTQSLDLYTQKVTVLAQNKLITKSEAQSKLAVIEAAQASLIQANQALDACDAAGATTCPASQVAFASAQAGLSALELWLLEKEKGKQ